MCPSSFKSYQHLPKLVSPILLLLPLPSGIFIANPKHTVIFVCKYFINKIIKVH